MSRAKLPRGLSRWRGLTPALSFGLAALLAFAFLLAWPTRLAFPPGDEPSDLRLVGFYGVERNAGGTYRWSRPAAELLLPLNTPGTYRLTLTLADNPAVQPPRTVQVTIDGVPRDTIALTHAPREYHFVYTAPPQDWPARGGNTARVALSAAPWSAPGDSRALGVLLTRMQIAPTTPLAPWQPVLLLAVAVLLAATWLAARQARVDTTAAGLVACATIVALGVWSLRGPAVAYRLASALLADPRAALIVLVGALLAPPAWAVLCPRVALRRHRTAREHSTARLKAWRAGAGVAALGMVTAFSRLGSKGLWGDEVWEASWSRQQSLVGTIERFRAPPDLPLHFVLTRLATTINGSEFWVRFPAALLGVLTVLALFSLGRRVYGTPTGVIAGVLLAIAPYHVWYAQEARPYAGLACYSTLALVCLVALLRRPHRPPLLAWIGLLLATAGNVLNHLFGVVPLLVGLGLAGWWLLAILLRARGTGGARRARLMLALRRLTLALASAYAGAAILTLPVHDGIIAYLLTGGTDVGSPPFQLTPAWLVAGFGAFGFGTGWRLALVAGLVLVGLASGLRRQRTFTVAALVWLVLPLALLALSRTRHDVNLRYLLFMQPIYLLLAARGTWQIATTLARVVRGGAASPFLRPALATLLAGVLVLAGLPTTLHGYRVEKIADWSAACRYLRAETVPADQIVGDGYFGGAMAWCFPSQAAGFVASRGGRSLAEVAATPRTVWYLAISPDTPEREAQFAAAGFIRMPRTDWARQDLDSTLDGDPVPATFAFPQTEYPLTIYVHRVP